MDSNNRVAHIISSYVPQFVVEHLHHHQDGSLEPSAQSIQSIVMVAHISGLAKAVEILADQDTSVLESTNRLLNDYFGELINHITDYQGDIVKFAGDNLLCIWPLNEHVDPAQLASQALSCAYTLGPLSVYNLSDVTLELAIGMSMGALTIMHLGGVYNRYEPLLIGTPISELTQYLACFNEPSIFVGQSMIDALDEATINRAQFDECLSPSNTRAFGLRLLGFDTPLEKRPKTNTHVNSVQDNPPSLTRLLQDYLPAAIKQRLVSGHATWINEFRRVSILYIQVHNIHADSTLSRIQRIVKAVQVCLYRYEGSLNRLLFNHQGITLLTILGLPPLAHEDDPLRAIKTARNIVKSLKSVNESCAIGVSTGRLFCTTIGNNRRREYTLLGYQINVAHSLMTHGGVSLLCDHSTYLATQSVVDFSDPLELLSYSNKTIKAYAPKAIKTGTKSPSNQLMAGREIELRSLENALDDLLNAEQSHVIIVSGEAGIGKSRLLDSFYKQVKASSATALVGYCDAIEKHTPYFAWQKVFSERLGIQAQDDSHTWVERIYGHLSMGHNLVRLAPLLNAVLPIEIPESELTEQMSGEVRAYNTELLLLELLKLSAKANPLVIILDDTHWMDSNSWRLAWQVSQCIKPVLLVLFTRPIVDHPNQELKHINSLENTSIIKLNTLNKTDTIELIASRLKIRNVPTIIGDFIFKRAEGHPYFSEELTHELTDKNVLEINGSECIVNHANFTQASLQIPYNIQGVITSRIDALAPSIQLILKIASVIGREFGLIELSAVHPDNHRKDQNKLINDAMDTLITSGLIHAFTNSKNQFSFKHIITKEVAYGLMSFNQKSQVHQKLATWYEEKRRDDLARYYPLLAYHWAATNQLDKAIYYLERAAHQALREFANHEVISFLDQAKTIAHQHRELNINQIRQARWSRMLGEAEQALGRPLSALEQFQSALSHLGYGIPKRQSALLLGIIKQLTDQILHRLSSNHQLPAKDSHQKRLIEAARAFERLFEIYWFTRDIGRLIYTCLGSVNLSDQAARDNPVKAMSYSNLAVVASSAGLNKQADYYSDHAMQCVASISSTPALIWVQLALGTLEVNLGRWQAIDRFNKGRSLSLELGDQRRGDLHTASLATVATICGRFNDGLTLYQQLFDSGLRRDDIQTQHWGLLGLAKNLYGLHRFADLDTLLVEAKESGAALGGRNDLVNQLDYYALSALIHIGKSQLDNAEQDLRNALKLLERFTQYIFLPAIGLLADGLFSLWIHPDTSSEKKSNYSQWAKSIEHWARRFSQDFIIGTPRLYFINGQHAYAKGDKKKALKAWQLSLKHARKLAMPYDEARACGFIAQLLEPCDHQRDQLEQRVHQYYTSIGVTYEDRPIVQKTIFSLEQFTFTKPLPTQHNTNIEIAS